MFVEAILWRGAVAVQPAPATLRASNSQLTSTWKPKLLRFTCALIPATGLSTL